MSLPFNVNSGDSLGLVQFYEKEIGSSLGHISGNTQRLRDFTAEANLELDRFFEYVFRIDGTWQFDDRNHSDFPVVTEDIVSGTRQYAITQDSNSNDIFEIYRAFAKDEGGTFRELQKVDQQSEKDTENFWDGTANTGAPYRYDRTGKWVDVDPVPNYNSTGGLKFFVSRGPHYFTVSDTTETAGIPAFAQPLLFLKPAEAYARRNGLQNIREIQAKIFEITQMVDDHFPRRTQSSRLTPATHSNK